MEPNLFSKYFKSVFRVLLKNLGLSDVTVLQPFAFDVYSNDLHQCITSKFNPTSVSATLLS